MTPRVLAFKWQGRHESESHDHILIINVLIVLCFPNNFVVSFVISQSLAVIYVFIVSNANRPISDLPGLVLVKAGDRQ